MCLSFAFYNQILRGTVCMHSAHHHCSNTDGSVTIAPAITVMYSRSNHRTTLNDRFNTVAIVCIYSSFNPVVNVNHHAMIAQFKAFSPPTHSSCPIAIVFRCGDSLGSTSRCRITFSSDI